jgi:uncharacterized membrane protein
MSKHSRWLQDQIGAWLDEGLIDTPLAETLRARYPTGGEDTPWARIIVSSVGAIVFGLGIILFFAYNWADMHKYVKLALVFAAVAAAHGAGFHLSGTANPKRFLVESMHVLGTMLFGAGIWLVAQIYHIDEHYPNAFLVWGLGAMALAWAMPSVAQGLMAVLLVFLWACFEIFDFSSPNYFAPWMVLLGVVPLAWLQRSRVLLFFALLAFIALYGFGVGRVDGDLVLAAIFYCACLYLAAGRLVTRSGFPESAPLFGFIGYGVYLVLLYALTFDEVAREMMSLDVDGPLEWAYVVTPLVAAACGWAALLATGAVRHATTVLRDGGPRVQLRLSRSLHRPDRPRHRTIELEAGEFRLCHVYGVGVCTFHGSLRQSPGALAFLPRSRRRSVPDRQLLLPPQEAAGRHPCVGSSY